MENKQIEEMAKILVNGCRESNCEECEHSEGVLYPDCVPLFTANALYNAGYRKASEVARETVEAIKAEVSKKEQYVNDLFGYGGYVISTTDLEDIIRRYIFDTYEEAELKKKYTQESEVQYG